MSFPYPIWFDGSLVFPKSVESNPSALAHQGDPHQFIMHHGLHYGTGVFEGIRCYHTSEGPAVFRLEEHLKRMSAGAQALGMDPLDIEQWTNATRDVLRACGEKSAYIRPLQYYSTGGLGLDVHPLKTHSALAAMPWRSHLGEAGEEKGVRLMTSTFRRNSSKALPPLKLCGGYVNSILAKRESYLAGYDEALFVDDYGRVVEATGENVFLVLGDEVVAVRHPDALPGITRQTIMQLTGATEREVTREELLEADEVFLTGTSAEVAPVVSLDQRTYGIGSVTREISQLYQNVVHGRSDLYRNWLTPVLEPEKKQVYVSQPSL